ncbi:MAG: response regulator, partial [Firmicutes bacterium]|nr:response regulator [Bacillota bacterium]
MISGSSILIIDDEPQIRRLLRVSLTARGYVVHEAGSGAQGLELAGSLAPDLVVLDLGLPDSEGVDVLLSLREWSAVPVVVLSVRDAEEKKVFALDHGADDYVTKPFSMGELAARIRLALRHRASEPDRPSVRFGDVEIDFVRRLVSRSGESVRLTPIEYDLLRVLAQNCGRVLTHKQLVRAVWGDLQIDTASHYLRVYIGHLRKKLERDPARPALIVTEPGVG